MITQNWLPLGILFVLGAVFVGALIWANSTGVEKSAVVTIVPSNGKTYSQPMPLSKAREFAVHPGQQTTRVTGFLGRPLLGSSGIVSENPKVFEEDTPEYAEAMRQWHQ